MGKYTLLTGATGLVGRYLTKDLLAQNTRLAVLVRPSKRESVDERVDAIVRHWEDQSGESLSRPVCLRGDVAEPNLGLSSADLNWVIEHCDSIIHNAAVLKFDGEDRSGDPWRTNVGGTQNVLDLCKVANIRDLSYVSTAYVCGQQDGPIMEGDLDNGQSFRNDYEESKFLAEGLVRKDDFIESPRIFRPAVIAGDSKTGYTNTYHGIYVYLRLTSTFLKQIEPDDDGRRFTPIRIAVSGDEQRNVVCVDWVSKVICQMIKIPETRGMTFHLAPEKAMTARDLMNAGYSYFNSYGIEYVGRDFDWTNQKTSVFEDAYLLAADDYHDYLSNDPIFDRRNLLRFAADIPCPAIDEPMLHRFWKYGEEDRWGKRKYRPGEIKHWASDYLENYAPRAAQNQVSDRKEIGFDITGPGGGQFTLQVRPDSTTVHRGISASVSKVVSCSVGRLSESLNGEQDF